MNHHHWSVAAAAYGIAIVTNAVWLVIPYFTGEDPAYPPGPVWIASVAVPLLLPVAFLVAAVHRRRTGPPVRA